MCVSFGIRSYGGREVDDDGSSLGKGDILSREHTDPVLNAKMHLINNVSQIDSDLARFQKSHKSFALDIQRRLY